MDPAFAVIESACLYPSALGHYHDSALSAEARGSLRDPIITHVVGAVDGYLLAAIMLIFASCSFEASMI